MIQKLGNVELYYDEYGTGDQYLLSAQSFHSKIDSYTMELAQRGFHVFNIQIRGYGKSSHVQEDLGDLWYETWAQDVCDFADAKGIDTFFYSGWSHGAGIGWLLCYHHPERVRGYFSIAGGPHTKDGIETSDARMRTIRAAENLETWSEHAKMMCHLDYPTLAKSLSEAENNRWEALRKENYDNWMEMQLDEITINPKKPFPTIKTEADLIRELETIKIPTLLLGGMQDPICLPENIVRSCRALKNSKMVIYESAAHSVPIVRQHDICDDIDLFCKQNALI